jgi:hypothetical protein
MTRVWRKKHSEPLKQPDWELKNLQGRVGAREAVEVDVGVAESESDEQSLG